MPLAITLCSDFSVCDFFFVRLLYIVQINKFAYLEAWMTALNFENWFSFQKFWRFRVKNHTKKL